METVSLFRSPVLEVREVVCDAPRGGPSGDEDSTMPCIVIPLRGCYCVNRRGQGVVADANTAIFFDAALSYRVAHPVDEGDVSLVIALEPGAVAEAFGNATRPNPERRPFRATHARVPAAVQLRTRLFRRALAASPEPLAVEEMALAIVTELAATPPPHLSKARAAAVERAKAFLGRHFREPASLADAARASGTSPFSLAHAFPAATGTTLHRYLVSLRLASALDTIAAGATDLSRVAVDAGFAHHSHFTKTFARSFGATPRAVRSLIERCPADEGLADASSYTTKPPRFG